MAPPTSSTSKAGKGKSAVVGNQTTLTSLFAKQTATQKTSGSASKASSSSLAPPSSSPGSTTSTIRSTSGVQRLSSIAFNTAKWYSALPAEQQSLLALESHPTYGLHHSYLKLLHSHLTTPGFLSLKRFLETEGVDVNAEVGGGKCYPPAREVYNWSRKTPLNKVKVVIIGQDPYHGAGQAHGLCFSVKPGVAVPASLRNIYTELAAEYPTFQKPNHGSLLSWATSGVLLLNTSLTVRPGQAGSHANKGWENFTNEVVKVVDRWGGGGKGVVFLCWGAWAAKRVEKLSTTKHLILKSAHPSPLSAHRGFLGNGHFKTANEWLVERHGEDGGIEWGKLEKDG